MLGSVGGLLVWTLALVLGFVTCHLGLNSWLPICMPPTPPSHDGEVSLQLTLAGGFRVVITCPSSAAVEAADLVEYISQYQPRAGSGRSDSFELVSSAGSTSAVPTRATVPETRDSILRSFPPCPVRLFSQSSRLCGSSTSGKDRVQRAWTCGQWARAVQEGRAGSPNRSPTIDLRSRFYAVLRAPGLGRPTIFRSSAGYWNCIGSLEDSTSISHSFPSEAEARIYLEAAGEDDPVIAP